MITILALVVVLAGMPAWAAEELSPCPALGRPPTQAAQLRCARRLRQHCRRFPATALCVVTACDLRALCATQLLTPEACEAQRRRHTVRPGCP